MKAQTFIGKKSIYLRRKSGNESMQRRKTKPQKLARRVCSHEKKGLRSREKGLHLTRKRASPHEKKGFTSRAQTPHLDFHPSIGCARAHVFVIFAF